MPEDMKELFKQRQRELAAERAQLMKTPQSSGRREHHAAGYQHRAQAGTDDAATTSKGEEGPSKPPTETEQVTPRVEGSTTAATRPARG